MAEREMTDEERKDFESRQLHHEDQEPERSGPAGETAQGEERSHPKPQVLPNPD